MTQVIFTVGISASGKTTWANEYQQDKCNEGKGCTIVNRDSIRHDILRERKAKGYVPYYNDSDATHSNIWNVWKFGKDEKIVTERWVKWFESAYTHNIDTIICADTNLNRDRLDCLIKLLQTTYNIPDENIEVKEFPITFDEAVRRDNARPDGVGYTVLWNQYQQWLTFIGAKKYVPNKKLPKAVCFDVDGTLAKMNGRGPFDWDKVGTDLMREEIADMFRGYKSQDYKMIVVSGRDGCCYEMTSDWLALNDIFFDEMFMRPADDQRDDRLIKEEIFWRDIAPKYNVVAWVDDRPKVVRKLRELGVNVIQVADPLIEF